MPGFVVVDGPGCGRQKPSTDWGPWGGLLGLGLLALTWHKLRVSP